jgi:hypothetical protein
MELISYKINKFNIKLIFKPLKGLSERLLYIYNNYAFTLHLFNKVYNNNIINL